MKYPLADDDVQIVPRMEVLGIAREIVSRKQDLFGSKVAVIPVAGKGEMETFHMFLVVKIMKVLMSEFN